MGKCVESKMRDGDDDDVLG